MDVGSDSVGQTDGHGRWCTDGRTVTDGLTDVSQVGWCADGLTMTDGQTDVAQD